MFVVLSRQPVKRGSFLDVFFDRRALGYFSETRLSPRASRLVPEIAACELSLGEREKTMQPVPSSSRTPVSPLSILYDG